MRTRKLLSHLSAVSVFLMIHCASDKRPYADPEDFMDQLVSFVERIRKEPVGVYVNVTYLPGNGQGL